MTDEYKRDEETGKTSFMFNTVPPAKRDMIYNFTLALKLPVQTLGLIESLVASELADFTMHDEQLCREIDPRLPSQQQEIDVARNLYKLTKDINIAKSYLKPIYADLMKNKADRSDEELEERLEVTQRALNLANTVLNYQEGPPSPFELAYPEDALPKACLKNLFAGTQQNDSSQAIRHVTIIIPGFINS